MIKKYYEISCDNCGNYDYLGYKSTKQDLIEMKWVIHNGKHFCCERCKEDYVNNKTNKVI